MSDDERKKTAMEILGDIALMDPEGVVDYDPSYSEYTPGGPIHGCVFCHHLPRGDKEDWSPHVARCAWRRARELLGLSIS